MSVREKYNKMIIIVENCITEMLDNENYEPIDIEERLLRASGLSSRSFLDAFSFITGKPFADYVRGRKFERAIQCKKITGLSWEEIARRIGYAEYPSFFKQFNRLYKCAPTEYDYRMPEKNICLDFDTVVNMEFKNMNILEKKQVVKGTYEYYDRLDTLGILYGFSMDELLAIDMLSRENDESIEDICERIAIYEDKIPEPDGEIVAFDDILFDDNIDNYPEEEIVKPVGLDFRIDGDYIIVRVNGSEAKDYLVSTGWKHSYGDEYVSIADTRNRRLISNWLEDSEVKSYVNLVEMFA